MSRTDLKISVTDEQWDIAVRREEILRTALTKKRLCAKDVSVACKKLGIGAAYFYRLLRAYKIDRRASALLPQKSGPIKGSSRLSRQVDGVIEAAIRTYYLSRQKPRVSKLHQMIALECHKSDLPRPSRKAIDQRLKAIDPWVLMSKREGSEVADEKLRPVTGGLQADRPLQIVQVDHTKVDVILVDEKLRLPIGRPWLTLLIDICTRMVTGYYLSLDPPSSVSVALALQQAVLCKDEWLAAHGISAPWPVRGLPECLHMDNGKEFHAKALRRGAEEYGIRLFYRPPATPRYGGHIERLIGTMMGAIHLLPGTTFSDIEERGAYDSEARATMTLKELDHWLAIEIVGGYHQRIHKALERPPIAKWVEMTTQAAFKFRHPADEEGFFIDFLPYVERKIGRDGINLFGIKYWDSVLSAMAGVTEHDFIVRYDPRNLSAVFVESPNSGYLQVRYRDLSHPVITLWEHRITRKALREQGRREFNERMLFDAIEAQRLLVQDASLKTKSARRQQQRVAEAIQPGKPREKSKAINTPAGEEEARLPVLPYEIEIWS